MATVARRLAGRGAFVVGYGTPGVPAAHTVFEAAGGADVLVFPLPITRDGLHPTAPPDVILPTFEEIFSRAEDECLALGGMVPPAVRLAAEGAGVELFDYYESERLLAKNAYATAEAAVAYAAAALPCTVAGTTVAILGGGRIAFCLLPLLRSMGAHVLLYARAPHARRRAEEEGATVFPLTAGKSPHFPSPVRVVFSTVPAPLFPEGEPLPPPGTLFYDLGGGALDRTRGEAAGVLLPPAAALPGKYAPESAGDYIFDEIREILYEKRGVAL